METTLWLTDEAAHCRCYNYQIHSFDIYVYIFKGKKKINCYVFTVNNEPSMSPLLLLL